MMRVGNVGEMNVNEWDVMCATGLGHANVGYFLYHIFLGTASQIVWTLSALIGRLLVISSA